MDETREKGFLCLTALRGAVFFLPFVMKEWVLCLLEGGAEDEGENEYYTF